MSEEEGGKSPVEESRRLRELVTGPQSTSMPLEERAYLIKLASAWGLLAIQGSLNSINFNLSRKK